MKIQKLREKKCKECLSLFVPDRPLCSYCCYTCALTASRKLKEKKEAKDWKVKKKSLKDSLKTHKDYLKILQAVFNSFIKFKDKDQKCISCDCDMVGRKGDASHYYSVGANANLRFNEDNCHLSCVPCNQFR